MEEQFELPVNEVVAEALRNAVIDNKRGALRKILRKYPHLVNSQKIFANGETLLHVAAENGFLGIVTVLIDEFHARADIVAEAGGGDLCDVLPIHYAAYCNHGDVVRKLAEAYPEGVNEHNGLGFTPLHDAITSDAKDAIRALLECGALDRDVTTRSCDVGEIDISVELDITTDDIPSGTTSLELAEILKRDDLAELLVEDMQNLAIADSTDEPDAIFIPSGKNRDEVISKLITYFLYESSSKQWSAYKKAIETLKPECKNWSRQQYVKFLSEQEKLEEKYWGEDFSEDSDEIDNDKIQEATPPEIFSTISQLQKTEKFWEDTRRTTPQKVGLDENLGKLVNILKAAGSTKKPISDKTVIEKLQECKKKITDYSSERAALPYASLGDLMPQYTKAYQRINEIILAARVRGKIDDEEIQEIRTLCEKYKIYIHQFRGINYMVDRWDAPSRRHHRRMVEVGQPQHSEMVLRKLPFNFYTDLNEDNDYSVVQELQNRLAIQDKLVKDFLIQLRDNGEACVDYTDRSQKSHYVFNNILDRLQHSYSNGVDLFLAELAKLREDYPDFWGKLPNACNPFVSTGHSVYHCLKYAYGMKTYYGSALLPRYHKDGKIEYSHVGKVYSMLCRLDEILFSEQPNNVPQLNKEARVRILNDIVPEKEISFLGFVKGSSVMYQYVAKFPNFSGEHEPIYEIKYGLNKSLYDNFHFLIRCTDPGSLARKALIDLLSEWLCAYHEVLLNRLMLKKVKENGGMLLFWGDDGLLSLEPPKMPMRGGELNQEGREQMHYSRQQREILGKRFRDENECEVGEHGFSVVPQERFQEALSEIPEEEMYERLKKMKGQQAFKLTSEQHEEFSAVQRQISSPVFKGTFFSTPQPTNTQPLQLFPRNAYSEGGVGRKKPAGNLLGQFDAEMRQARLLSLDHYTREDREPRNLFGLEINNVEYDEGDCLFVGVSADDDYARTEQQLRQVLVQAISTTPQYRKLIQATLDEGEVERTLRTNSGDKVYHTVDQYLTLMGNQGTWGRQIEIQIMANILQRPIVVLTPRNQNDLVIDEPHYANNRPIFLSHVNYGHFQPLRASNPHLVNEILQNIRASFRAGPRMNI